MNLVSYLGLTREIPITISISIAGLLEYNPDLIKESIYLWDIIPLFRSSLIDLINVACFSMVFLNYYT